MNESNEKDSRPIAALYRDFLGQAYSKEEQGIINGIPENPTQAEFCSLLHKAVDYIDNSNGFYRIDQ